MLTPIIFFLGGFSAYAHKHFSELPYQAIGVTIVTFFVMLLLYQTHIIDVTKRVRSVIITVTTISNCNVQVPTVDEIRAMCEVFQHVTFPQTPYLLVNVSKLADRQSPSFGEGGTKMTDKGLEKYFRNDCV